MGMFETSKKILEKVSFDKALFYKELIKALKWLTADEKKLLKAWCFTNFGHLYKEVIIDAFEFLTTNNITESLINNEPVKNTRIDYRES
jgi:hypothetical protein